MTHGTIRVNVYIAFIFFNWRPPFLLSLFIIAVSLIKAAQGHARYCIVNANVLAVRQKEFSPAVRFILSQLCELLMIYWLMDRSGDFVLVIYE